jgi:glutamate dehydrogenase (NADP+)
MPHDVHDLPAPTQRAFAQVMRRNRGDDAFLQAVHEVLASLGPLLEAHPELLEWGLLERLLEPERQAIFRVPWQDDAGGVHVARGFRIGWNSALGPYKGGLRFHESVTLDVMKFLAFEQTFKNALTGLGLGGGKGGADFDPKGRSDAEIMRFCQSFMIELQPHVGEQIDVPAGDIGVGEREIGYLFGQYRRLRARHEAGVFTGKGVAWGGSLGRKQATGFGLVYFAAEMLHARGRSLDGATCLVSGSGNVAIHTIEKLQQSGARVIACSDSGGALVDPAGLDLPLLTDVKQRRRGRLTAYAQERQGAVHHAGASVWDLSLDADAAFPCATQNELPEAAAVRLVRGGVALVAEGANMPCTPEAVAVFAAHGVAYAPGKASNAGGVSVSGFEMQQNAQRARWSFEEVDARLRALMRDIHRACAEAAAEFGRDGDVAFGANVVGFGRVVEAMRAQGVI